MTSALQAPRIDGAKIGVFVENKFIPEEIAAYAAGFPLLGAQVDFVSRIWYGDFKPATSRFYSDVDPLDDKPWESPHRLDVQHDVSTLHRSDYDAVIMAANYTSIRLRYADDPPGNLRFDPWAHVQSAPVVRFFAEAMNDKRLVKGLLCHGLWILTPNPALLKGRRVICHTVVMADVLNCGAIIQQTANRVVIDDDLVTGFSKHETLPFIAAIAAQVAARRTGA